MQSKNDFTQGSIPQAVMRLAPAMIGAQIINALYSVVDKMYIGRLPDIGADALAGVGITFPFIMIVSAFAMLAGMAARPCAPSPGGRGYRRRGKDHGLLHGLPAGPGGGRHRPVPGH